MNLAEWISQDLAEAGELARRVEVAQAEGMCELIQEARRVFVTGRGRTGLVMEMFAMRLMQLGLEAKVVGEATTPAISAGDLLVAGSGSGETSGVLSAARRARQVGARVVALTAQPASSLGHLAECVVVLPGETTKVMLEQSSRMPLGSVLEQVMLVFLDSLAASLAHRLGETNQTMMARHANLE